MADKILGLLGLMRKASALAIGEDNTTESIHSGKAKLVLLPKDISEKRRKNFEILLSGKKTFSIDLPYESAEIADAVGVNSCSVLAVTDVGFAESVLKLLSAQYPEYQEAYEEINRRREKMKRRKQETLQNGRKNQREGE